MTYPVLLWNMAVLGCIVVLMERGRKEHIVWPLFLLFLLK